MNFMKIRPLGGTTLNCVISKKSADVTLSFRNFADPPPP